VAEVAEATAPAGTRRRTTATDADAAAGGSDAPATDAPASKEASPIDRPDGPATDAPTASTPADAGSAGSAGGDAGSTARAGGDARPGRAGDEGDAPARKPRRRGSRGGRKRNKPRPATAEGEAGRTGDPAGERDERPAAEGHDAARAGKGRNGAGRGNGRTGAGRAAAAGPGRADAATAAAPEGDSAAGVGTEGEPATPAERADAAAGPGRADAATAAGPEGDSAAGVGTDSERATPAERADAPAGAERADAATAAGPEGDSAAGVGTDSERARAAGPVRDSAAGVGTDSERAGAAEREAGSPAPAERMDDAATRGGSGDDLPMAAVTGAAVTGADAGDAASPADATTGDAASPADATTGATTDVATGATADATADATTGRDAGEGRGRRRRGRGGSRGGDGNATAVDEGGEPELPERHREGRASVAAAAKALVPKIPPPRKPKIGDTIPAPTLRDDAKDGANGKGDTGRGAPGDGRKKRRRRKGRGAGEPAEPVEALLPAGVELDDAALERRKGRERKGRPVGRYSMCVHLSEKATQIAVLEGRALIEHYVSRPSDDVAQIHGNVYLGRVQNVLPGMEAAFVDIGTPKNAVLYRGDVHYDQEDVERKGQQLRIEQMLKGGQSIICQVTKNPIGAKGARLTQEVSLPGRFVVLIPNSSTYGISKRLADEERKRLRTILDKVKPAQHGIIVRTAAQNVTSEEIEDDVLRLARQWQQIEALAKRSKAPALLYREPDMAVRVIREEFNQDYRNVAIDDPQLYEAVRDYVTSISPELADRVEFYDPAKEQLPIYERYHVHEQLHRALDRKVWLPSGGSLIIEHTEALTVIDVNTGKNVGRSNLEETVYKNNVEAAVEIARQLRLRDIGGIIVIDFIDMERRDNRDEVVRIFRDALSRDKTRTQVFEISELGLCEMTRKRIGEGLLESFAVPCPECEGRGVRFDEELLPD